MRASNVLAAIAEHDAHRGRRDQRAAALTRRRDGRLEIRGPRTTLRGVDQIVTYVEMTARSQPIPAAPVPA